MPKIIQDIGEKPLVLHSAVQAPLASLSFLQRSLAFAELAMISYNDESEAHRASTAIGFPEATLLDNDGSQAFQFCNDYDCIVRSRDRWRGLLTGLFKWKLDFLSDHSIHQYAEHIARAVENENQSMVAGRGGKGDYDFVT